MNLYAYIASNNPRKANLLLRNNGFGEGKTTSEIERRLKQYVREEKDSALQEMAKIHPDKELLVGDGVSRELLNYTGADRHRNYMGEQFIQNLDTTTYYGPKAAQNPYRPIAPDYFNNAIGVDNEKFPQNKSLSKEDVKEAAKEAVKEANGASNGSTPAVAPQQAGMALNLSQSEILMLAGFLFLGYMIGKKGL